jgi:hypothetical protein
MKGPLLLIIIILISGIFLSGCLISEISSSKAPLQRPNTAIVDLSHKCWLITEEPRCMIGTPTLDPSKVTLYSNGEMWINPSFGAGSEFDDDEIISTMCDFYAWYTYVRPNEDIIPISSIVIEKTLPDEIDVHGNHIPQPPQIQVKLYTQNIGRANWCNLKNYPDKVQAIHANFDFFYGI